MVGGSLVLCSPSTHRFTPGEMSHTRTAASPALPVLEPQIPARRCRAARNGELVAVLSAAEGNCQGGKELLRDRLRFAHVQVFVSLLPNRGLCVNANEQGNARGQEPAFVLQDFWAEGCMRNKKPATVSPVPVHAPATSGAIKASPPTLAGTRSHPRSQPAWLLPAQTFSFL